MKKHKPRRSRPSHDRRSATRCLGIQPLEPRVVMDASAALTGAGVLEIDAGNQAADVEVCQFLEPRHGCLA